MSHFYIILPSDGSKDVFPNNSAANFKTRLETPISLVGEWDVASYEIHYKRLWHAINPIDAEIVYEITSPSTTEESSTQRARVYLYQGYYSTMDEVVASLNSLFNNLKTGQKLDRVPTFGYNIRKRKFQKCPKFQNSKQEKIPRRSTTRRISSFQAQTSSNAWYNNQSYTLWK